MENLAKSPTNTLSRAFHEMALDKTLQIEQHLSIIHRALSRICPSKEKGEDLNVSPRAEPGVTDGQVPTLAECQERLLANLNKINAMAAVAVKRIEEFV